MSQRKLPLNDPTKLLTGMFLHPRYPIGESRIPLFRGLGVILQVISRQLIRIRHCVFGFKLYLFVFGTASLLII